MSRTIVTTTAFICRLLAVSLCAAADQPISVDEVLERIRLEHRPLPALAAAVVRDGQTVACGAVGFRKQGATNRVTIHDRWHIGSCTKSMTGALAGMMVEKGRFRWDMTVAEMFPELAPEIGPDWRAATLDQFLAHRGGAEAAEGDALGLNPGIWERANRPPTEQRDQLTRELLTKHGPVALPGTRYIYSNSGYVLIGHALELRLKQPWETVIRERLFQPLGMESAGFGPPATANRVDQPWGHLPEGASGATPKPPDDRYADNPAALGPAGTVHCGILDLAKYAAWQVRGARGQGQLLKPETFKRLHTRIKGGDYAGGWQVVERDWAGGEALTHQGSAGTFMTVIWLAPKRDFAVVVCANLGGTGAQAAVDEAVSALIGRFLPNP